MHQNSPKRDVLINEDFRQVERLEVPGGWLYITTYNETSVATTFVPDPNK